MNPLLITVFGLVSTTLAMPQYGGNGNSGQIGNLNNNGGQQGGRQPNLPAGCTIQYKTVYDIVENEKFETKCVEKYKPQCTERYNRVCTPYQENICKTAYEAKCDTKYKDNCFEAYRDVKEPYVEDVCVDKDVAVCDKHWECQNPNLPIANCNDKVWVDNQNSCKYLKKSICTQVEKYRTRSEPYQKCDQVSWQDCNDVPYEVCDLVDRENCKDVPYQDCQQVSWQDCNPVHKKVSSQVSQKRPFRVCNNSGKDPYRFTDDEIADYDFIELRTGAVEEVDQSVEEVTTKKPVDVGSKSSSAITFG